MLKEILQKAVADQSRNLNLVGVIKTYEDFTEVIATLPNLSQEVYLQLSNIKCHDALLKALDNGLLGNNVTNFSLRNSNIGDYPEILKVLARSVIKSQVSTLSLDGNNIDDQKLTVLVNELKGSKLVKLALRYNKIGNLDTITCDTLFKTLNIKSLDLTNNEITENGFKTLIKHVLPTLPNTSIIELDLTINKSCEKLSQQFLQEIKPILEQNLEKQSIEKFSNLVEQNFLFDEKTDNYINNADNTEKYLGQLSMIKQYGVNKIATHIVDYNVNHGVNIDHTQIQQKLHHAIDAQNFKYYSLYQFSYTNAEGFQDKLPWPLQQLILKFLNIDEIIAFSELYKNYSCNKELSKMKQANIERNKEFHDQIYDDNVSDIIHEYEKELLQNQEILIKITGEISTNNSESCFEI